jgi:hypothetical protein
MSRFLELPGGDFINIFEISSVVYEFGEETSKYYSYLFLKNGTQCDFLELPIDIYFYGKKEELVPCHIIFLHKRAIYKLFNSDRLVIGIDEFENMVWANFEEEYEKERKKIESERG